MAGKSGSHESFVARSEVKVGSDRGFGYVFAVVFALIALWPLTGDGGVRLWAMVISGGFIAVALIKPVLLKPLNRLWFRFGMLLHRIINPIIMGLLFYVTIMPIGLIMRLFGKDFLRLRIDKSAESYWIKREPIQPDSMRNQF